MATNHAPVSGLDLLLARRVAGLRQEDVAQLMGIRRQRVSALEREFRPSPKAARRYLEAIAQGAAP